MFRFRRRFRRARNRKNIIGKTSFSNDKFKIIGIVVFLALILFFLPLWGLFAAVGISLVVMGWRLYTE